MEVRFRCSIFSLNLHNFIIRFASKRNGRIFFNRICGYQSVDEQMGITHMTIIEIAHQRTQSFITGFIMYFKAEFLKKWIVYASERCIAFQ